MAVSLKGINYGPWASCFTIIKLLLCKSFCYATNKKKSKDLFFLISTNRKWKTLKGLVTSIVDETFKY